MVLVQAVTAADFEQVYPLLNWHGPEIDKAGWRRIFDYGWARSQPHCGYALFDGEEAVGFLGTIFSDRPHPTTGQLIHCCNLSTWVVKPEYRGHSLALMMPVIRLKDTTLTDLSPGDGVVRVSRRLGFQVLETEARVLLPRPRWTRSSQLEAQQAGVEMLIGDRDAISRVLSPSDLQTFSDHNPYPNCHQLLCKDETDYCYVVYTEDRNATLSYAQIHHISHPGLFKRYHWAIRQQIMQRSKLPLVVVDARLTAGATFPLSYRIPLSAPRLYRSEQLAPAQIDNLYSELALLSFDTADALTLELREKVLASVSPALRWLACA